MRNLTRYLSRMFLARNISISLAMVAILAVLDALSKGDVLPTNATLYEHFRFMFLRAPLIFEQVFIFAFLLSLLVTYVSLIRRNELVPIVYAGLSVWHQIKALLPVVLTASVVYAVLLDQGTPRAQSALMTWLGPDAVIKNATLTDVMWVSDNNQLVRIKAVQGERLEGLTIFERTESGRITAVNFAEFAVADDKGWRLGEVRQIRYDLAPLDPPTHWQSALKADTLRLLSLEPRYLSLHQLWTLSRLDGAGNRTASIYKMWIYSRAALPLVAVGFMIVTALLMQRFGRQAKPELVLVGTMAAGFVYVIFDSISKTLPEKTTVSAATAALAPLICLMLSCCLLALWKARS